MGDLLKTCRSGRHQYSGRRCTQCARERNRRRHQNQSAAQREKHRVYCQTYYRENRRELIVAQQTRYLKIRNDPEQWARYLARNRGRDTRQANAEWYRRNPDRAKAKYLRRRALKAGAATYPGAELAWPSKVEYWGNRCYMCRRDDVPLTMDHVKPLIAGGPHIPANWRPACERCNKSKRQTWPMPGLPMYPRVA